MKIIKAVYHSWKSDRISERAAALSYYSIISLVPLAVFTLALASFVLGPGIIEPYLLSFSEAVFGVGSASFFEQVLDGVKEVVSNTTYSVLGILLLLYGASRLFAHLRKALHEVFVVEEKETDSVVKKVVRERGSSLLYLILAFVLAVLFIIANVAITASLNGVEGVIGQQFSTGLLFAINTILTLIIVGGLYAFLYRVGSHFELKWNHAFSGGLVASLLFLLLNGVFAFYLQLKLFVSVFTASTFVIALLLWIYYGIQILFIGAEVADVYERGKIDR